MDSMGKALGGCLLIIVGIAGLLMSVCGGFLTITTFPVVSRGAVLPLLIGVLLAWLAFAGFKDLTDNEDETGELAPTPPSPDRPPAESGRGDEQSKKE